MTFWKDKKGNELTFKQFLSRWKRGIESVNPLQQVKMQLWSTWIILIGIVCGIVITCFAFKSAWWLTIILVGALFNTLVQMLGLWQKKQTLDRIYISFLDKEEKVTDGEGKPSSLNQENCMEVKDG